MYENRSELPGDSKIIPPPAELTVEQESAPRIKRGSKQGF